MWSAAKRWKNALIHAPLLYIRSRPYPTPRTTMRHSYRPDPASGTVHDNWCRPSRYQTADRTYWQASIRLSPSTKSSLLERKNIHRIHFKSEPMGRKIYLSPGWTAGFTSCQQLLVEFFSCSLVTQHDLLASVEIEPQPWFFVGVNILWFISGWTSISLSLSCVKV